MIFALLLSSVLATDSPGSGEAVFEQMRAANAEIRTLVFDFKVTQRIAPKATGPDEAKDSVFAGRVWFQEPHRIRVEYTDSDEMVSKTMTIDQSASRHLLLDRKSGVTTGAILEGGSTALGVHIPGLSCLILRTQFDFYAKYLPLKNLTATRNGKLIQLSGIGFHKKQRLEWLIDPEAGFHLLKQADSKESPVGESVSSVTYEPREVVSGIWIPIRVTDEHFVAGKLRSKTTAEVVPGTWKVNESLPAGLFELMFPVGTQVTDGNQRKAYVEGGGTSRSRQNVENLANEAKRQVDGQSSGQSSGQVTPMAGALTTATATSTRTLWIIGSLFVLTVLCVVFVIRQRSRT